jgi:pimeloyl-ACP methyl ester carboxylesterase
MRDGRRRWAWAVAVAVALGMVGAAWAQDRAGQPAPKEGTKKAMGKKAGIRAGGGAAPPKGIRKDGANALGAEAGPEGPVHYRLKIGGADGSPLAASYYPSKLKSSAPVLMLIHDRGVGRAGKDFEEPIEELKGKSFAEFLQEQEYAVLVLDLRGHGSNPRREVGQKEWPTMIGDLQAAYMFLVDLHNQQELNLAKLGVVALGDGANLAVAWAASPGGAVSSEGRTGDLGAMVLISPVADAQGIALAPRLASLAPRVPILLISGKRGDAAVKAVQNVVERHRLSKVVFFDTPLSGHRLINLFPGVAATITKFLDDPIKFKTAEWEPRYLLTPVNYTILERLPKDDAGAGAAAKKDEPAKKDEAPAKKDGAPAGKKKGERAR